MHEKLNLQNGKEKGEIIFEKYNAFLKELNNTSVPPVKVFYPLNKHLMEQLMLVREASKTLQKKKEDDIHAAQEAANKVEVTKKPDEEEPEKEETSAKKD